MWWLLSLPKSIDFPNASEIKPAENGNAPKPSGILAKDSKFWMLNTLKIHKILRELSKKESPASWMLVVFFISNVCSRSCVDIDGFINSKLLQPTPADKWTLFFANKLWFKIKWKTFSFLDKITQCWKQTEFSTHRWFIIKIKWAKNLWSTNTIHLRLYTEKSIAYTHISKLIELRLKVNDQKFAQTSEGCAVYTAWSWRENFNHLLHYCRRFNEHCLILFSFVCD